MNTWSNIEISPGDPEVIEIDELEKMLGDLAPEVRQIRELITRFEVCHFKYQHHIENVKTSILQLRPGIDPQKIGANHIKNGQDAWKKDETGRSLSGQKYLWALSLWLDDSAQVRDPGGYDEEPGLQITKWLGEKTPDKERLVRLLLARLLWDWKSLEELQSGGEYKELESQICRMDICHYSFPAHLDLLLQGIGGLKPVEPFEGCGSCNSNIKTFIEKEFSVVNDSLKSLAKASKSDKNELIKVWLFACLAKTLKEQVGLAQPIHIYSRLKSDEKIL